MNFLETHRLMEESSKNRTLVVIDIQPAYQEFLKYIIHDFCIYLNEHKGPILYFFNDENIGCDSLDDVRMFLLDFGVEDEVIDRIEFKPKQYAFFRNWMDAGMERGHIIKAIRYMVMKRVNDSRDVSDEEWTDVFGGVEGDWNEEFSDIPNIVRDEMISIPDVSIGELKSNSPVYLCGGGRDECLSEFRFLFEAFNIPYRIIKRFVYGG